MAIKEFDIKNGKIKISTNETGAKLTIRQGKHFAFLAFPKLTDAAILVKAFIDGEAQLIMTNN